MNFNQNASNIIINDNYNNYITNTYNIPIINNEGMIESNYKYNNNLNNNSNGINTIWTYVENKPPNYIKLNVNSYCKYYEKEFNIVVITNENYRKYAPELPFDLCRDEKNFINKIDILKYYLLYKYGGLWIDSSTLIFKYFNIKKELGNNDLLIFENPSYEKCINNNLSFINTKIIYSKPNLNIIKNLLDRHYKLLNYFNVNVEFNNYSEKILYSTIKLFLSVNDCGQKYSNVKINILPYYLLGKILNKDVFRIKNYIEQYNYKIDSNSFCTFIDNNENYYKSPNDLFYYDNWFLKLNDELLNGCMFISYLYRQ